MRKPTFTGRDRDRGTPRSVRRAEAAARILISAGGFGTIIAVTLIFGFLLWVVFPLFSGAEVTGVREQATRTANQDILGTGMDEYRLMAWTLDRSGTLRVLRLDSGEQIAERPLLEGTRPTAWAFPPGNEDALILAFADGTIRPGTIKFEIGFVERAEAPEEVREIEAGKIKALGGAIYTLTRQEQIRKVELKVTLEEPRKAAEAPIVLVDMSLAPQGRVYAALSADGQLATYSETTETDMSTFEEKTVLEKLPLPYTPAEGRGAPAYLKLAGIGNMMYLVWADGHVIRYDTRDALHARPAETFAATERDGNVTLARFLIGKTTLVVGDGKGALRTWFPTKPKDAETVDGVVMRMSLKLKGPAAARFVSASPISRILCAGYADGTVELWQTTTGNRLLEVTGPDSLVAVALAPRVDAMAALYPGRIKTWTFDPGHPEATLASLTNKVWYEGLAEPAHVWQSTGGSDDFEPKLGLMPLIFGTLKATLYAMLIAVPIALLAAVFTSEFLNPKWRTTIKSVIEMMASLPSVVLGFMAAVVIAPFVQSVLPATLACFLTVPLLLVIGSRLWQLLPQTAYLRLSGFPRLGVILLALPLGILAAASLGPMFERVFFAGDMMAWLEGRVGAPGSGWTLILLPLGALLVAFLVARFFGERIRAVSRRWSHRKCAVFDIGRMLTVVVGGLAVAAIGAWLLGKGHIDPRGEILGPAAEGASLVGIVGSYAQRNAMIVGFVMGFAIVPIIYTLAEDALSAVPTHLREASLGAGASNWQTAQRIVIPTAMSGLFGAIMVGLGRAVGETMIVLMAAGNTPLMEWNPFNGFRTLSANIAVELPEAVRNSTHYRTLFLAAFVLFGMTFVLNTVAELVRRRFRKRYADQL